MRLHKCLRMITQFGRLPRSLCPSQASAWRLKVTFRLGKPFAVQIAARSDRRRVRGGAAKRARQSRDPNRFRVPALSVPKGFARADCANRFLNPKRHHPRNRH